MFGNGALLERLDKMLEDGINGTFEESDYDETKLSKLETKWLRYLAASKMSFQKTVEERHKLKELVSDISHQTKTPLANILLYTQLLQEQEMPEESRRLVTEIQQQSEKLEFLIQSLVKTSRLETGTFQLYPEVQPVAPLIRAVTEQAEAAASKKRIRLTVIPADCTARYDSKWTQEALFNLLDNAVKYSPEDSGIRITAEPYELFVCISVSDRGCGIAEEELPRIFGRFYRGSNVREQSGVGIGLYLARQIAEGQGGYITAESRPGAGSVFRLCLPR